MSRKYKATIAPVRTVGDGSERFDVKGSIDGKYAAVGTFLSRAEALAAKELFERDGTRAAGTRQKRQFIKVARRVGPIIPTRRYGSLGLSWADSWWRIENMGDDWNANERAILARMGERRTA